MEGGRMKVAVIGAGIVGAAVAAELAERGADVTVFEAGAIGGGTTSTSYAWINSNGKTPREYFDINLAGLEAMRAAARPWFEQTGHLEWAADAAHAEGLARRVARQQEWGYDARWVSPSEARELVPALRVPDDAAAIAWFPEEGLAYPVVATADHIARARAAGAEVRPHTPVTGVEDLGRGVRIRTPGAEAVFDTVVSCAGRWTADVTSWAGASVPMVDTDAVGGAGVGYLATTAPVGVDLRRVVTTSPLNVRPAGGGRFLLQSTVLDATADPSESLTGDHPVARELTRRFGELFVDAEDTRVETFVVGRRVMPADGLTVAGRLPGAPNVYVVATHSGVTLSVALARWVADELGGKDIGLLAPFRPDRLLDPAAAYTAPAPRLPGEQ